MKLNTGNVGWLMVGAVVANVVLFVGAVAVIAYAVRWVLAGL